MRAKQRSNIQGEYLGLNIPIEIIRSAEMRGLDAIATGGGCDYITRTLSDESNGPRMVLGAADDAGSPDTLTERANVTLYLNDEDWSDGGYISFNFDTTVEALDFMAGFETTPVLDLSHMKNNPLSCRSCGRELGTNKNCGECRHYGGGISLVALAKKSLGIDSLLENPEMDRRANESARLVKGGNDERA